MKSVTIYKDPGRGKDKKPKGGVIGMPTRRQITPKRGFGGSMNVGDYGTHEAPRVGGAAQVSIGVPSGGTKKQIRASKIRVKRNDASPQAKMSAKTLYRK